MKFTVKSLSKYLLSKFGLKLINVNFRTIPFGSDWRYDVSYYLSSQNIKTVFDVGANLGQTSELISEIFKNCDIYCFEPVAETFNALQKNLTKKVGGVRAHCFRLALGDSERESEIIANPLSGQNTLLPERALNQGAKALVQVERIDHFCKTNNIAYIDILKIDTEGYELNVLRGAQEMLRRGHIDFILAECDFSQRSDNDPHGNFFEIFNYLSSLDYDIVSFYTDGVDQRGWRWGNVLFKHAKLLSPKGLGRRHMQKDICRLNPNA